MDPLYWAVILLVVGLVLAVGEVFVPSGGILGFLTFLALLSSVVMAFRHGVWTGLGFSTATLTLVPALLVLALRVWPKTPLGRRILIEAPRPEEVDPHREQRDALRRLVGQVGRARVLMLPSGPVVIAGKQYDATSEGLPIEAGSWVRVIEARAGRLIVRPTKEPPAAEPPPEPEDPLARPIDTLGIDPFRDEGAPPRA